MTAGLSDEYPDFGSELEYPLAVHAEAELLRERLYAAQNALVKREAEIARLTGERDRLVREALLSLAAELEAEAENMRVVVARPGERLRVEMLVGCDLESAARAFGSAARMARERAGVDPDAAEHASARQDKAEHVNGVPDGAQGRDGLPQILAMLRSCADEAEGHVVPAGERADQQAYVAGMRRAIDLIEHGDQPAEAQPS